MNVCFKLKLYEKKKINKREDLTRWVQAMHKIENNKRASNFILGSPSA